MQHLHFVVKKFYDKISPTALFIGVLFLAASLTPSLLPRHYAVQGVLSGLAMSIGYGLGVGFVWIWRMLEIPDLPPQQVRIGTRIFAVISLIVLLKSFMYLTAFQNSIRQLMEMPPVESAYPWRVLFVSLMVSAVTMLAGMGFKKVWNYTHLQINRVMPQRLSYLLSLSVIVLVLVLLINGVFVKSALHFADDAFLQIDQMVEYGIEQPLRPEASGSSESLLDWDAIGRQGKNFIAGGPSQESIGEFLGKPAKQPLRVYVGLGSGETVQERARLALEELKRVGGFERSTLIIATPTGTGWLDPGAVDTIEYLHAGDTAIVAMQYSYLPSWMTLFVDPTGALNSAQQLFAEIYSYWTTLPKDQRPNLYVHGLSLGAYGSESSVDLFTIFEDPIQGGLWSGPPFPSGVWRKATLQRNPDSPMWMPRFRDGSLLRFTGQQNSLQNGGKRWGPMRFVYLQHASDPMTFFSPTLVYSPPRWLAGQRGPDVSPLLRWYPIVTFLQSAFDIPMATSVPMGYGHNFSASSYIDAWCEVTNVNWDDADILRLKQRFD